VVADAGLFEQGLILVGTAAFQTYPALLGAFLSSSAVMTNDADFLAASFVQRGDPIDLEAVLRRADPSFAAHMSRTDTLPKVFRAADGFQVEILTRFGRGRKSPLPVPGLSCAAEALSFMEYLAHGRQPAVVLYGAGVLVSVPPPVRYALHKLLIAPERNSRFSIKAAKDLQQAADLIDIFLETDPDLLLDELEAVRARGPRWRRNVNASLVKLGRVAAKGKLPMPA
jgi:hypothetical protein